MALAELDTHLGRIDTARAPDDLLLLIFDPGRNAAAGEAGLVVLSGAAVEGGELPEPPEGEPVDPLAVAPTLLWMAGFPVGSTMPAEPLTEWLRVEARAARPVARADPGAPPAPSRHLQGHGASESRARDHLKSLGYIE